MFATASRTILLVVEDHPDTADLLTRYLGRRGIQAASVGNGMSALEYIEHEKPCCLLLDENMPGMTGLELFQQLLAREETKSIPVFFYSASYDWRKQMEANALGAKGWFVKGVTRLEDMLAAIRTACEQAPQ
jgi:two-component system sensor histidine kinase ChiS